MRLAVVSLVIAAGVGGTAASRTRRSSVGSADAVPSFRWIGMAKLPNNWVIGDPSSSLSIDMTTSGFCTVPNGACGPTKTGGAAV